MNISRRKLLQALGTTGAVSVSGCFGGELTASQDTPVPTDDPVPTDEPIASAATPTPSVDEIPEGGIGENFELIGHDPLYDHNQYVHQVLDIPRGSNGDIAIAGDVVYVGSLIGHQPPLIVDISDPADPEVIGPIPDAIPGVGNGIEGIEVSGDVLVLDHRSPLGEEFDTPEGDPARGLSVYDVSDPREPHLVARHDAGDLHIHATSLWRDPEDADRLLAVQSNWDEPTIIVFDLTGCPDSAQCDPTIVAEWSYEDQTGISEYTHEATLSTDGQRMYVPQWDAGTFLLDSSNLMESLREGGDCDPSPPEDTPGEEHCLTLLNPNPEDRLDTDPPFTSESHHSTLKVPGRPYLLVTAESTGPRWDSDAEELVRGGCPGAFTRLVYIGEDEHEHHPSREEEREAMRGDLHPQIAGVFGLPEQQLEHCTQDGWAEDTSELPAWFSPHYATVFPDLAFVTYYGAGLRAIDISNPFSPIEAGYYFNHPVEEVRWTSYGMVGSSLRDDDGERIGRPSPTRPFMMAFSYPVIHDGYVIYADVHSGLYILEYDGPHADQIPDEGTCESGNPGQADAGYEPCPPYGQTEWTGERPD